MDCQTGLLHNYTEQSPQAVQGKLAFVALCMLLVACC
jgi:hypothetical protein